MPEISVTFQMPVPTPGPCQVGFACGLLSNALKDLACLTTVEIEPFATGLQITGQGDRFTAFCLVAGCKAPEE